MINVTGLLEVAMFIETSSMRLIVKYSLKFLAGNERIIVFEKQEPALRISAGGGNNICIDGLMTLAGDLIQSIPPFIKFSHDEVYSFISSFSGGELFKESIEFVNSSNHTMDLKLNKNQRLISISIENDEDLTMLVLSQ